MVEESALVKPRSNGLDQCKVYIKNHKLFSVKLRYGKTARRIVQDCFMVILIAVGLLIRFLFSLQKGGE